MGIHSDEKMIMIGPASLNDETDVRMAFHVIREAAARLSVIRLEDCDAKWTLHVAGHVSVVTSSV